MGDSWTDRYLLFEDGRFEFYFHQQAFQASELDRLRSFKGMWEADSDTLTLYVSEIEVLLGGVEIENHAPDNPDETVTIGGRQFWKMYSELTTDILEYVKNAPKMIRHAQQGNPGETNCIAYTVAM